MRIEDRYLGRQYFRMLDRRNLHYNYILGNGLLGSYIPAGDPVGNSYYKYRASEMPLMYRIKYDMIHNIIYINDRDPERMHIICSIFLSKPLVSGPISLIESSRCCENSDIFCKEKFYQNFMH